jgi:hypothetical protein
MKYKEHDKLSHVTLSITEVEYSKNHFTKYTTIGLTLTFILAAVIAFILCLVNDRILDFDFKSTGPFMTSPISLGLILLLIISMLSFLLCAIVSNKDNHLLSIYYNEVSGFYMIMMMLLIGPLLFGMIYEKSYYSISINLLLSTMTLICSFIIFRRIKAKKNVSLNTLLSLNIGNCVIMSFEIYVILYSISSIICKFNKSSDELRTNMGIVICCLYGAAAIAVLTDSKDIVFSICMEIINLGFLTGYYNLLNKEIIASVVISSFVFVAVLVTIYKYKRMIFGYEDDEDLIKALDKHRASSNKI